MYLFGVREEAHSISEFMEASSDEVSAPHFTIGSADDEEVEFWRRA